MSRSTSHRVHVVLIAVRMQNAQISTNVIAHSSNVDLSRLVRQEIWMHECIGSVLELERPVSSCCLDVKGRKCHMFVYTGRSFYLADTVKWHAKRHCFTVARYQYIIFRPEDSFYFRSCNRSCSILPSRLRAFTFSRARFPRIIRREFESKFSICFSPFLRIWPTFRPRTTLEGSWKE